VKSKTVFYCTECGNETPKWQGRCPGCGAWNTLIEHTEKPLAAGKGTARSVGGSGRRPRTLDQVEATEEIRFPTGLGELDRVLGGGAVTGSLVLVGGAPGIGKSTLLLQICSHICQSRKVLYISGEESEQQLKLRAQRLGVSAKDLYVLSETNMDTILEAAQELSPDMLIIDSIQTLYNGDSTSSPGSVAQVKACTMTLMQLAKTSGMTIFVVGHVNKEGSIAGPKVLEHMVDCVLYFEGDRNTSYRLLRAVKNRFGSTNEIGVFEMQEEGLVEVPNPSEMLLAGRPVGTPGTCVACIIEGSRPILAEVQALVTATSYNVPRRTTDGFDFNRAALLLAVMEKRGGLHLSTSDAYINVIGGMTLDEPAADLPVVIAVASCYRDMPVDGGTIAIGEVGLTGEIRSVTNMEQRLNEIVRLGFSRCIIPRHGTDKLLAPAGLELLRVRNIREAIEIAIG
jgi:DNA repair protein RadA/Sms